MQSLGAFEIGSAVDSIPIWGSLSYLTEYASCPEAHLCGMLDGLNSHVQD